MGCCPGWLTCDLMDLPIRESLGSVVVADLKAEKQRHTPTPLPTAACGSCREQRGKEAGVVWYGQRARAVALAVDKARGGGAGCGKGKQEESATACSYIGGGGARGQARAKATGQALASSPPVSARCTQHASRDYFADCKSGGPPGPGRLWRDARGLPSIPIPLPSCSSSSSTSRRSSRDQILRSSYVRVPFNTLAVLCRRAAGHVCIGRPDRFDRSAARAASFARPAGREPSR